MKVELIAHTEIDRNALETAMGYVPHERFSHYNRDFGYDVKDADELAEAAGRLCYMSQNRPNPATAENRDYLANIQKQQHESVFEHASATFLIETSRSVLAEMTRHRHLSFSVVSQRYVDAETLGNHYPPILESLPEGTANEIESLLIDHAIESRRLYRDLVTALSLAGKPRKQAREAARAVLPNMTSSPMVVTGNHRAWRDVLKKRWHVAADAEIREVAGEVLRQLRAIAPHSYSDIPDQPYSY